MRVWEGSAGPQSVPKFNFPNDAKLFSATRFCSFPILTPFDLFLLPYSTNEGFSYNGIDMVGRIRSHFYLKGNALNVTQLGNMFADGVFRSLFVCLSD